jgi:hypothetical protein
MGAPQRDLPDVVAFVRQQFDSLVLVQDLNDAALESGVDVVDSSSTLYRTAFLGVLLPDNSSVTGNGDGGRDNLNDPTNFETEATEAPASNDRTTITIVGGLLVAAFACAFLAILYILWRRRQHYVRSQQVHMSGLDKISVMAGDDNMNDFDEDGRRDRGAGSIRGLGELGPYNTSNTDLEEEDFDKYDDEDYGDKEHRMMMQPDHRQDHQAKDDIDDESDNNSARSPSANPMQFDLGNSFKDQLMGVYGGGGSSVSKRSNGGLTGSVLFPAAYSVDGDSDADSWAQTDGTIGSLELQLEPITAEV